MVIFTRRLQAKPSYCYQNNCHKRVVAYSIWTTQFKLIKLNFSRFRNLDFISYSKALLEKQMLHASITIFTITKDFTVKNVTKMYLFIEICSVITGIQNRVAIIITFVYYLLASLPLSFVYFPTLYHRFQFCFSSRARRGSLVMSFSDGSSNVLNFRHHGCLYVCVYIFRERDRAYQQATGPAFSPQRTDGPRFTGGGFNLKPPAKAVA